MLNLFSVFSFVFFPLIANQAFAEKTYGQFKPPEFKIGRLALQLDSDVYNGETNYDYEGKTLNQSGEFSAYNVFVGAENDFSTEKSAYFGLLLGYSKSVSNGERRSLLGIKGIQFGYSRRYQLNKVDLITDATIFLKTYSLDYNSDEVSLGDGVTYTKLGAWIKPRAVADVLSVYGYGGINWNFGSLAQNAILLGRAELKLKSILIGGGINFQKTLVDDKTTDSPTNRLLLITDRNGGSNYYHSVNPEFLKFVGWIGFEPWELTELNIGYEKVLKGENTVADTTIFANLKISYSLTRSGARFPYFRLKKKETELQRNKGIRRLKNHKKSEKKEHL